jgi:hypothetical protein
MNEDQFNELALKLLSGEATPQEVAQLQQALQASPQLAGQFQELKGIWGLARKVAPLARALDLPASKVPDQIHAQLSEEIKSRFERSSHEVRHSSDWLAPLRWQWAHPVFRRCVIAVIFAVMVLAGFGLFRVLRYPVVSGPAAEPSAFLVVEKGQPRLSRLGAGHSVVSPTALRASDKLQVPQGCRVSILSRVGRVQVSGPDAFEIGAFVANHSSKNAIETAEPSRDKLFAAMVTPNAGRAASELLSVTRDHRTIVLYAPLDSTAELAPVIRWKADPGKKYDLEIWDEFGTRSKLVSLSGVTSPVDLARSQGKGLAQQGLYRLILQEQGVPFSASEYSFRTLDESPSIPAERSAPEQLLQAYELLAAEPARTGDALQTLLSLPSEWANSEFSLRLQLYIFGTKGYQEDFNAVAARLW